MVRRLISLILIAAIAIPAESVADSRLRGMMVGTEVSSTDLEDLGSWGANVIRYQLYWAEGADTADASAYRTWLREALDKFDALLPTLQAQGMRVILDLHTPPGGFADRNAPALVKLFTTPWTQQEFVEAWKEMTTRYQGNSTIWAFDLCNEPGQRRVASGLKNWSTLAKVTTDAIRTIDPSRTVIIQPPYGDQARLNRLKVLPHGNVIYSIHYYYPPKFQRQGLDQFPIGPTYPKGSFNKGRLRGNLARAIAFQKRHKKKIYVGEFSAIRWAPQNSAYRYLRDLISIFERQRWHWTYHAFREFDGWSVEHSTDPNDPNPSPTRTDREQLLRDVFTRNS